MTKKQLKAIIQKIQNCKDIQGQHGNWDHDAYMFGMYNGIELCLATLEERDTEFKTKEEFKRIQKINQL